MEQNLPFKISESKKLQGKYCCAYACKNTPKKKLGGLCHKHYWRKRKNVDPVYVRYNQFKNNATVRKKDFTITLKQFRDFCEKTGYIITPGKRGRNATIDRINNNEGYHIWNIQLMTLSQNCKKGTKTEGYEKVPF